MYTEAKKKKQKKGSLKLREPNKDKTYPLSTTRPNNIHIDYKKKK